jgi:hypothetical protein
MFSKCATLRKIIDRDRCKPHYFSHIWPTPQRVKSKSNPQKKMNTPTKNIHYKQARALAIAAAMTCPLGAAADQLINVDFGRQDLPRAQPFSPDTMTSGIPLGLETPRSTMPPAVEAPTTPPEPPSS